VIKLACSPTLEFFLDMHHLLLNVSFPFVFFLHDIMLIHGEPIIDFPCTYAWDMWVTTHTMGYISLVGGRFPLDIIALAYIETTPKLLLCVFLLLSLYGTHYYFHIMDSISYKEGKI
jgi:hypothetical protein